MSEAQRRRDMEVEAERSLSGQQVQALGKRYAEQIAAIKDDIALRKLALDQACNVIAQTNSNPGTAVTFHDPIQLAKAMHAFLVEGANDKTG